MSSLFVALVAPVVSSFRTRVALQAEILALVTNWLFSGFTPQGVGLAHAPNQVASVRGYLWPSGTAPRRRQLTLTDDDYRAAEGNIPVLLTAGSAGLPTIRDGWSPFKAPVYHESKLLAAPAFTEHASPPD